MGNVQNEAGGQGAPQQASGWLTRERWKPTMHARTKVLGRRERAWALDARTHQTMLQKYVRMMCAAPVCAAHHK